MGPDESGKCPHCIHVDRLMQDMIVVQCEVRCLAESIATNAMKATPSNVRFDAGLGDKLLFRAQIMEEQMKMVNARGYPVRIQNLEEQLPTRIAAIEQYRKGHAQPQPQQQSNVQTP